MSSPRVQSEPGAWTGPDENTTPTPFRALDKAESPPRRHRRWQAGEAEVTVKVIWGQTVRGLENMLPMLRRQPFNSPTPLTFLLTTQKTEAYIFQSYFCFSTHFRKLRMTLQTLNTSQMMLSTEIRETSQTGVCVVQNMPGPRSPRCRHWHPAFPSSCVPRGWQSFKNSFSRHFHR